MINEVDFVDLGLSCAGICQSLDQEIKGRGVPHAGSPILEAIEQLTTWVESGTHAPGDLLTKFSITAPWAMSRDILSNVANGAYYPDPSTGATTRPFLPGSWSSIGFVVPLRCISSPVSDNR